MPSTVTGDDIIDINGATMEPCDVMSALIENSKQLKNLINYQFGDDGLPTIEFVRDIGHKLLPPGTFLDFYFPSGTSQDAARSAVEKTWLTAAEITLYDNPTTKNQVTPFFVVADELTTNGAPNMSGRFRLQADYRAAAQSSSGVSGVGVSGGIKENLLTIDQMPKHKHTTFARMAQGTYAGPSPGRFLYTPETEGGIGGSGSPDVSKWDPDTKVDLDSSEVGGTAGETGVDVVAHTNMPPYYVVIMAFRTKRVP